MSTFSKDNAGEHQGRNKISSRLRPSRAAGALWRLWQAMSPQAPGATADFPGAGPVFLPGLVTGVNVVLQKWREVLYG